MKIGAALSELAFSHLKARGWHLDGPWLGDARWLCLVVSWNGHVIQGMVEMRPSVNFSLEKLRSAKSGDLQISMITSAYKCLYRKRLISSSSMFEGESCCDVLWCMRKVRGSLATALESLKFVLDCLKIVGSPGGDRCWPARFALVK